MGFLHGSDALVTAYPVAAAGSSTVSKHGPHVGDVRLNRHREHRRGPFLTGSVQHAAQARVALVSALDRVLQCGGGLLADPVAQALRGPDDVLGQ